MPFRSASQRRFAYATKAPWAAEFEASTPASEKLPERVAPKSAPKRRIVPVKAHLRKPAKPKAKPMKKHPAKKMPKLGSGERFAALKAQAGRSGARNPAAVAAAAGRKKYGPAKMASMAAEGRRRAFVRMGGR